jgi:hypothetical protein
MVVDEGAVEGGKAKKTRMRVAAYMVGFDEPKHTQISGQSV